MRRIQGRIWGGDGRRRDYPLPQLGDIYPLVKTASGAEMSRAHAGINGNRNPRSAGHAYFHQLGEEPAIRAVRSPAASLASDARRNQRTIVSSWDDA